MRRDTLRLLRWGAIVLLLALLVSGCTRSKSSGPPDITVTATDVIVPSATSVGAPTDTPLSGTDAVNATTDAMAATATAEAGQAQDTAEPTGETPEATATTAATVAPTGTAASAATDTPQATQAATATQSSGTSGATTHTVQAGENLFRIALQYGMSYQRLAAYNGITNPNIIYVGQVLNIPADGGTAPPSGGRVHVVQQGENLFRIALQYNMLYTDLARVNNLSYPYTVYPGQRLQIP